MRIVCLSDTHELHRQIEHVPEGDVLLHAGDFTNIGAPDAVLDFAKWLGELPHPQKFVIAGNHDWLFERDPDFAKAMMCSSGAVVLNQQRAWAQVESKDALTVWGEPRQPEFYEWAFNVPREQMRDVWAMAPRQVDIVLTHGPPFGICDYVDPVRAAARHRMGDKHLRAYIEETQPRLVVCGHNHQGYGEGLIGRTRVVNASICNIDYEPVNAPIVVDL